MSLVDCRPCAMDDQVGSFNPDARFSLADFGFILEL